MDTEDDVQITGAQGDDTLRNAPHSRFDCVVRSIPPPGPTLRARLAAPPAPRASPN